MNVVEIRFTYTPNKRAGVLFKTRIYAKYLARLDVARNKQHVQCRLSNVRNKQYKFGGDPTCIPEIFTYERRQVPSAGDRVIAREVWKMTASLLAFAGQIQQRTDVGRRRYGWPCIQTDRHIDRQLSYIKAPQAPPWICYCVCTYRHTTYIHTCIPRPTVYILVC